MPALTETFDHFHRVHEEYHGLLDDEEDIEESQVYFEYIQKVFKEAKGKIDLILFVDKTKTRQDALWIIPGHPKTG